LLSVYFLNATHCAAFVQIRVIADCGSKVGLGRSAVAPTTRDQDHAPPTPRNVQTLDGS
jgi:hypothetical protein